MDANTLQAVQITVGGIGAAFVAWLGWKTQQNSKKMDDVHKYTNSLQGKALRDLATALAEKAVLSDSVTDKVVAAGAKVDAAVHDLAQAKIDAGKA